MERMPLRDYLIMAAVILGFSLGGYAVLGPLGGWVGGVIGAFTICIARYWLTRRSDQGTRP